MKKLYFKVVCLSILFAGSQLLAQTKTSVTAVRANPAEPGMYRLSFDLDQELDPQAEVVLDFPEAYDLSAIKIAGSNEINGGIQYAVDDSKLILKRSGKGTFVPKGKNVSIVFGPLKNPDSLVSDWFVQVSYNAKGFDKGSMKEKIKFE